MSHPRQHIPGTTWFITRSIIMQIYLLVPGEKLNNFIYYVLAYVAQKYQIEVHALCVMCNHYHMVVTDTEGKLPKFLQEFNRLVAMGVKTLRRWPDQVWESGPPSKLELAKPKAIVEKIAYTMANPVAAFLVEHADEFPGAKTLLSDLGRGVIKATRPDFYISEGNEQWEEELTLPLTLPPMFAHENDETLNRLVAAELESLERAAHNELREKRGRFLGVAKIMKLSPRDRAKTPKPRGQLNPTFAVGRGNAEALKECIEKRRAFLNHYRQALARWRAGDRDAVFPPGTWWMRVFHKAKTADTA